MCDAGVDVDMPPLRPLLHVVVAKAPVDDLAWCELAEVLVDHGYNVNYQVLMDDKWMITTL